ncbi:MAG: YbhB/YbcL family Raf kinase inhibitor-like protein [Rhodomicrobium sp.]
MKLSCLHLWFVPLLSLVASASAQTTLDVTVHDLTPDGKLPFDAAYCVPPSKEEAPHDISPAVSWSQGPAGTKSYVLIMTDLDVPNDLSLINKAGVTLTPSTPRVPFIHWVLIDIPPGIAHLDKGVEGSEFIAKGKAFGHTDHGIRGLNVFSHFYPEGSPFAGPHAGYDGPCPPLNDTVTHRYVTDIYALDVASLGLSGQFYGEAALEKMKGHLLASGRANAGYGGAPLQTK